MKLIDLIVNNNAKIGVIGLGYVGLPLVIEFCKNGSTVIGFDIDEVKVKSLKEHKSYINHISSDYFKEYKDLFFSTNDFTLLHEVDIIIICLPTPLNNYKEPDLSFVIDTSKIIAKYLRKEQLVILESTTYPGTTEEVLKVILEENSNLVAGKDFYLAFSPEREDPNNPHYSTSKIPKVVGGLTENCLHVAVEVYKKIIDKVIPVSSTKIAEASKILENTYRAVNIAMINEMKMLFDRMNIDIWEVIEAAKTKPFGFQAFYPGPGLGGHCIPIDPFYLTWKAKEYDFHTKFIELAGEINTDMPLFVIQKVSEALNMFKKCINGSKILILGLAYKKDVDDTRESPSLRIIELLQDKGAFVDYNDPFIPKTKKIRKYELKKESIKLTADNLKSYDLVLILTDHSVYDADFILEHSNIIVDTRNLIKNKNVKKLISA